MKRKTYSYLRGRTQRVGAKFEARPTEYVRPEAEVAVAVAPAPVEPEPADSDESGDDSEKD